MPVPALQKLYITEKELSDLFGIPVATLQTWRSKNRRQGPPFAKVGKRILYETARVRQYLAERTIDPEKSTKASAAKSAARR